MDLRGFDLVWNVESFFHLKGNFIFFQNRPWNGALNGSFWKQDLPVCRLLNKSVPLEALPNRVCTNAHTGCRPMVIERIHGIFFRILRKVSGKLILQINHLNAFLKKLDENLCVCGPEIIPRLDLTRQEFVSMQQDLVANRHHNQVDSSLCQLGMEKFGHFIELSGWH